MSAIPQKRMTEAEYLEIESGAEFKSEFFDGVMYPMQGPDAPLDMAGARFNHKRVRDNLNFELVSQLQEGPWLTLTSDQRVKIPPAGMYAYPDILIYCGEPEFADDKQEILLNPRVIIEVLSPSTELYDRGPKFRRYQKISSVCEYVLVSQAEPLIECYFRQPDGKWALTIFDDPDGEFTLTTVAIRIPMAKIYRHVMFTPRLLR